MILFIIHVSAMNLQHAECGKVCSNVLAFGFIYAFALVCVFYAVYMPACVLIC